MAGAGLSCSHCYTRGHCNGSSVGRLEQVSRTAKSHDRMIYDCFGSKKGLVIDAARRSVAP